MRESATIGGAVIDAQVSCPCGRVYTAGAADCAGERETTCGGCGRVYRLTWLITIEPTGKTGGTDLLGHLRQSLRERPPAGD